MDWIDSFGESPKTMKSGSNLNRILTNEGKNERNNKNSKFRQLEALCIIQNYRFSKFDGICERKWEKIGFVGVNYAFKFLKLKNTLKLKFFAKHGSYVE